MIHHIFISIGNNCNSRLFLKNKLKITRENGYKTCPFDLCITSFESLYNCIETDFQYFFDNLHLIYGTNAKGLRDSSCGKGEKDLTNSYKMIFNHESTTHSHLFKEGKNDDEYYIKNNFEEFKKRYIQRINNFKNYIIENDKITLIYHNNKKNLKLQNKKLQKLLNLFHEKYINKIFYLMII